MRSLSHLGLAAVLFGSTCVYAQVAPAPAPPAVTPGTAGTAPTVSSDPTEQNPAGTPMPLPKVDPSTLPDTSRPDAAAERPEGCEEGGRSCRQGESRRHPPDRFAAFAG